MKSGVKDNMTRSLRRSRFSYVIFDNVCYNVLRYPNPLLEASVRICLLFFVFLFVTACSEEMFDRRAHSSSTSEITAATAEADPTILSGFPASRLPGKIYVDELKRYVVPLSRNGRLEYQDDQDQPLEIDEKIRALIGRRLMTLLQVAQRRHISVRGRTVGEPSEDPFDQ